MHRGAVISEDSSPLLRAREAFYYLYNQPLLHVVAISTDARCSPRSPPHKCVCVNEGVNTALQFNTHSRFCFRDPPSGKLIPRDAIYPSVMRVIQVPTTHTYTSHQRQFVAVNKFVSVCVCLEDPPLWKYKQSHRDDEAICRLLCEIV